MTEKKGLIELGWFGEMPEVPPVAIAAHQAADRLGALTTATYKHWLDGRDARDLFVRAFLAGARWQLQQLQVTTREAQYLDGFVTGFEELQARGFFLHHEDGRVMDRQDFMEAMVVGMNAILQKTTIWRAGWADKDTTPSTGSIASPDKAESEHRGKS